MDIQRRLVSFVACMRTPVFLWNVRLPIRKSEQPCVLLCHVRMSGSEEITAVLLPARGYMPRVGSHLQPFRSCGVCDLYQFYSLDS
jgi:hypothetical protein